MSRDPHTPVVLFFWCWNKPLFVPEMSCRCGVKEQAGMSKYCIFLQVGRQYNLEQALHSVPAWVDFCILL